MLTPPNVQLNPSSRARRIILRLNPSQGCVVVTYPQNFSKNKVLQFINLHRDWIEKALQSLPERPNLNDGGIVLINGQNTPIFHTPTSRQGCVLDAEGLHVSGQAEHTERRVQRFLRELALRNLPPLVQTEAYRMGADITKVDIRNVRSRWGSCTRTGRIMLSWRLIMCPPSVQSYIVVHELAHLKHFDHSPAFWSHVDHFFAKGRTGRLAAERWLGQNGPALLRVP